MKKHAHINLALLAVIGVLLLFANFSTNDHRTLEPLLLSTINPDSITTIKVIRSDKPALEFYKNEDGWFMRAPLQIRINKARINAMLRATWIKLVIKLCVEQAQHRVNACLVNTYL